MTGGGALAARAREITTTLVGWPSVTGTPGEAAFTGHLAGLLRAHPHFAANPDDLVVQPLPGDPLGRANLFALVRGAGRRAVALSGHFDTVPTDDYGPLEHLAGNPEALCAALIAELTASGANPLALADLTSGAFLPGRGLLDMKAGLAAGVAVLEAHAADPARAGSLLLIATPDEEDRSAGMRAAADALPGLLGAWGLELALCINLDALCDEGDGTAAQVAAMGCIGKLLLSAYVVGEESHACYPLAGVNAAYLAAALVTALEYAPELGEADGAEVASPPTVLGSRDGKAVYNVTIPASAFVTWNVLTRERRGAEVLQIARALCARAAERARAELAERAGRFAGGPALGPGWGRVTLHAFADVLARAEARDPAFAAAFAARGEALAAQAALDLPARCRELTTLAWAASGLRPPAIVLGFASMPYPAVACQPALEAILRPAAEVVGARHRTPIRVVGQLPVIVDMPFLGPVDEPDLRAVAANTPTWGTSLRWDLSRPATPGVPIVNLGPWGRNYHHRLERAHERYAFEVLPDLVAEVARRALAG